MKPGELRHLYFEWMYRLVCDGRFSARSSYRELLMTLFDTRYDYEHQHPNDERRAMDGIDLRYQFASEEHLDYRLIATELDICDCSVLEMLIALAKRCEDIAADDYYGDRTGQWFWNMLYTLGIANYDDLRIVGRSEDIRRKLHTFFENEYLPNGEGGLFRVDRCNEDLRGMEIWKQMCLYLNTYYL